MQQKHPNTEDITASLRSTQEIYKDLEDYSPPRFDENKFLKNKSTWYAVVLIATGVSSYYAYIGGVGLLGLIVWLIFAIPTFMFISLIVIYISSWLLNKLLFLAHSIYKLFWSRRKKKRFKKLKSELESVLLHEKDIKG